MSHFHCKNISSWGDHRISKFFVDHIFVVTPPDQDTVDSIREDVTINGLVNPLLLVPCDEARYNRLKHSHNLSEPFPRGKATIFVLMGGSNRLEVIKELGAISVDCLIMDYNDFSQIQSLQRLQRKPLQR